MSTIFSSEILQALAAAAFATTAAAIMSHFMRPYLVQQRIRREKALNRLKEKIEGKLNSGVALTAQEIADIGRGLNLSTSRSMDALYELYADTDEKEKHETYRSLIEEINRTEPFEALPEEVRPSLARLSSICTESSQASDKELLHPITKVLSEYQDMKRDHATIRKQGRISYVVALVSFFIGVVGLVLAFSGPSKGFIEEELSKATKQLSSEINAAQQGAAADAQPTAQAEHP